jgi:phage RecT family recombinase
MWYNGLQTKGVDLMPEGTQQVATHQQMVPVDNENLATMRFDDALEAYAPRWAAVLPPYISVAHFKGVVITAVNLTPELRYADRRTFFNACSKCASDGLLPDGQEAALVVYRTKVKARDGSEHYIDAVQYLPMVQGIRKRMRNTGEVISATAEVVYRKDKFFRKYGDNPEIIHEPPQDRDGNQDLGADRGEPRGAYAIIKLTNGEVLRDVLTKADIAKAQAQSKQPHGLMWSTFWEEAWRKTALKRCSKQAPKSSVMETLMGREDEPPELPPAEELPMVPARPRRVEFADLVDDGTRVIDQQGQTTGDSKQEPKPYRVVALAGDFTESASAAEAAAAFQQASEEAARQKGAAGIVAVWESNGELLFELRKAGLDEVADELAQYHSEQVAAAEAKEQQDKPPAVPAPAAEFWQQADLHMPPPTYRGKAAINFKAWRDTMLAAVKTAPSDEALGRWERDNAGNVARFEVAMKPAKQEIQVAVQTRRTELQAGRAGG